MNESQFRAENPGPINSLAQPHKLLNTKLQVRTAAFAIVYRSNFANKDVKYGALINEFKKAKDMDKRILKPILTNPSITNNTYCHIACALRGEKNDLVNEYDEAKYEAETLGLNDAQKKTIFKYMNNVSF